MSFDYLNLARALLPEIALVCAALAVLGLDLAAGKGRSLGHRLTVSVLVAAVGVLAAIFFAGDVGTAGSVHAGMLVLDRLAVAARIGVLVLALLALGTVAGGMPRQHPAEYVALILFATTGLTLMPAAQNLLVIFLALELASLSLYVIAAFDKLRPESAEAGLKYFLAGGMSAAFLLFGFSLLYGITGTLELAEISRVLAFRYPSPLMMIALVMILVAFGFKAAAAPFHLWAPDAYEGAPAPSAALIASASKLAGIALFGRLLWPGLGLVAGDLSTWSTGGGWLPIAAVLVAASLLLGNFAALAQTSVRRLLAYSAIAHAGVMLLGVIAAGTEGFSPVLYYAATYGVATAGAFGVLAVLERSGPSSRITDLAGLRTRSPMLAACLFIFILSLAGIPPLAGFLGKFYVFAAALHFGNPGGLVGWLVVLAILLSAVGLYYYLLILKQALVAPSNADAKPSDVPAVAGVTLTAAAALLVILGIAPGLVLNWLERM